MDGALIFPGNFRALFYIKSADVHAFRTKLGRVSALNSFLLPLGYFRHAITSEMFLITLRRFYEKVTFYFYQKQLTFTNYL